MEAFWAAVVADRYMAEVGFCLWRAKHRWDRTKVIPLEPRVTWGPNEGKPRCTCATSAYGGDYGQCSNAGKVEDAAGRWWCGNHSPSAWGKRKAAVEARKESRRRAWAYEDRMRKAASARKATLDEANAGARAALQAIADGDNDPRATARAALAAYPEEPST